MGSAFDGGVFDRTTGGIFDNAISGILGSIIGRALEARNHFYHPHEASSIRPCPVTSFMDNVSDCILLSRLLPLNLVGAYHLLPDLAALQHGLHPAVEIEKDKPFNP